MIHQQFRLPNRIEALEGLVLDVEAFGESNGLSMSLVNQLNLVLDEHLNNVISYGYTDDREHVIVIDVAKDDRSIVVEIIDDGQAFDPLNQPPPDLTSSLQDRKIGGLGIHFMRTLMDTCSYERVNGENRLRLQKNIAP
jgi:serine/threonine-protein kinase RsbW